MPFALSQRAYVTLLLHALKHPASAVSGVVLGPAPRGADAGGSPPGSPRAGAARQLTLTVPLFHTQPALAPMLEVALAQVEAYAAANGLAILAYYAANERPEDTDLSPASRRIADKIAAACPGACALLVRMPLRLRSAAAAAADAPRAAQVDAAKLAALGSTSPEVALKARRRFGGDSAARRVARSR